MKNVKCQHALAGGGQAGILVKHLEICNKIKTQLQALHISGLAVNVLVTQSIMIAIIQIQAPDLQVQMLRGEILFKVHGFGADCPRNLFVHS